MTRRTAAVLVAGLVLALTAGCVRLPEDGPVLRYEKEKPQACGPAA